MGGRYYIAHLIFMDNFRALHSLSSQGPVHWDPGVNAR